MQSECLVRGANVMGSIPLFQRIEGCQNEHPKFVTRRRCYRMGCARPRLAGPVLMSLQPTSVIGIAIAALGGAAVGLEREWSGHAGGAEAHFAGIRTFTLLGGMAGVAGWLWTLGFRPVAIVLLAGATALVVAAYVSASRRDVDGTTEVAALVVLSAGVLAGTGYLVLASAIVAITTLLLVFRGLRTLSVWAPRITSRVLKMPRMIADCARSWEEAT